MPNVVRGAADACWPWSGKTDQNGYGVFYLGGGDYRAPRFAYEVAFDTALGDRFVCHRCDNPRCVNPAHLFLGTSQENTADRQAKGRHARGERQGKAKLTDASVREIRRALSEGATQTAVARRFGVTQATIGYVKQRKIWGHVT